MDFERESDAKTLTFSNPSWSARSRKHRRQMLRPYLRMRACWLAQTRLKGRKSVRKCPHANAIEASSGGREREEKEGGCTMICFPFQTSGWTSLRSRDLSFSRREKAACVFFSWSSSKRDEESHHDCQKSCHLASVLTFVVWIIQPGSLHTFSC